MGHNRIQATYLYGTHSVLIFHKKIPKRGWEIIPVIYGGMDISLELAHYHHQ